MMATVLPLLRRLSLHEIQQLLQRLSLFLQVVVAVVVTILHPALAVTLNLTSHFVAEAKCG